jgi:hypothetical protein
MDSLPAIKGSALHDQSSWRVYAPPPVRLLAKVRRKYSQDKAGIVSKKMLGATINRRLVSVLNP